MELGLSNTLLAGDPRLVDHIVGEVKSQGIFDQFRKECIADVDTKPAYQNLHTRVEGSVNSFLNKQIWKPDLNKNQLRETLRKHIHDAPYLDAGIERIVDQVVNPKVYSVFMPQIEDVVYKFLGIERPKLKEKNGACGLKDLLPKDLDPVSPESDKNSLKDVSLESVDGMNDLEEKKEDDSCNDANVQEDEISTEKDKDTDLENGQEFIDEKSLDDTGKCSSKTGSNLNLNTSGKSDDKTEEDEEDSPTFEPIDIMNLNESNVSNDSHLSGISELTSHKSRSPDFSNDLSHDNFEYSNQDSQLSKVSSDSRLSIVTDFGSSNHASTPVHESGKDETNKEKCDKTVKDNFKAVREFESCKNKNAKNIFEINKNKDIVQDVKESKTVKSSVYTKENSHDATDAGIAEKYDHKHNKEKQKENDSSKSKSKEKNHVKDGKYHRERCSDKKKERSHSSSKYDKYDKNKPKDQSSEKSRESIEKSTENSKDPSVKPKDEKPKDQEKKDSSSSKEVKDLKDLYKEKIRELREKKELTEKEKLNKDSKEVKPYKENKEDKESPKDKKAYKKEHKSSSSRSSSSGHESKSVKTPEKSIESKEKRTESKDKGKRDEKRLSKDSKTKNHVAVKVESGEKSEKQDTKKISKPEEKSEKSDARKDSKLSTDKTNGKKETKNHTHRSSSRSEKTDGKKDYKSDSQNKEKKRKDDKKPKPKEDHCSLRKDSNDRRSTDRDGSNGSSSKSSQSSTYSSGSSISKSNSGNLSKETGNVSNPSSETSDSIEEINPNEYKLGSDLNRQHKVSGNVTLESNSRRLDTQSTNEFSKSFDSDSNDSNSAVKKRSHYNEEAFDTAEEVKPKKPKFAKNIHEAKRLMKIRKQMEKQKTKENRKVDREVEQKSDTPTQTSIKNNTDNFESVPDEERVQIIEVPDEEYDEPYPYQQPNLTLEETAMILGGSPCAKDLLENHANFKLKLADVELCIGQSISEEGSLTKQMSDVTTKSIESTNETNQNPFHNNKLHSVEKSNGEETSKEHEVFDNGSTLVEEEEEATTKDEFCIFAQKLNNIISIRQDSDTGRSSSRVLNSLDGFKTLSEIENSVERNTERKSVKETLKTHISSKSEVKPDTSFTLPEDDEDCRYFKEDNEKSEKFSNFLESLDLNGSNSLEDIIECLGGQVVSSKAMAPPLPKRKHSFSPLSDILLNNSNNNNDGHKNVLTSPSDDSINNIKKRKLLAPNKQRLHSNSSTPQGLLNGENFVMPLSPESDVSATSEKIPSGNLLKEDKGRHRSSQRYSSDDLYKPRPLFSSSSRRSRRSNQA